MAGPIQNRRSNRATCLNNEEMIDVICQVMDKIVALSQRELRARACSQLQESQRLQRELKKAVEFRGSLLARYAARNAA